MDDSGTPMPVNPLAAPGISTEIVEITTVNTGDSDAVIATKTSAVIDFTLNLPLGDAIINVNLRKTNAGGGSAELHTVQLYT